MTTPGDTEIERLTEIVRRGSRGWEQVREEALAHLPSWLLEADRTMTTVTLTWEDPEKASDFLHLAADLRRDGYLMDFSRDALVELVQEADVVLDDGGSGG